jgi:hypothetical protein
MRLTLPAPNNQRSRSCEVKVSRKLSETGLSEVLTLWSSDKTAIESEVSAPAQRLGDGGFLSESTLVKFELPE